MSRFINEVGNKHGRLTVLSLADKKMSGGKFRIAYNCLCDCGKETVVLGECLRAGASKSCGCIGVEHIKMVNYIDGRSKTKEYRAWSKLFDKCYNSKDHKYYIYGKRGIKVCQRWKSFDNFLADMGKAPTPKHSIDRIDVNGDYEPSNCRWATIKEQANNKTTNVFVTYNGETKTLVQWAEHFNVKYKYLHQLHRRDGKTFEEAIEFASKDNRNIIYLTYNGETKTLIDWTKKYGFNTDFFRHYYSKHKYSLDQFIKEKIYLKQKTNKDAIRFDLLKE